MHQTFSWRSGTFHTLALFLLSADEARFGSFPIHFLGFTMLAQRQAQGLRATQSVSAPRIGRHMGASILITYIALISVL